MQYSFSTSDFRMNITNLQNFLTLNGFKIIYFMTATFFFTDFLYSPHALHDCSRGQIQIYETSDALSLDSPNTVC